MRPPLHDQTPTRGARILPWIVAALSLSECLPADTRPTPASLVLTAEASAAMTAGVATSDGWQITFERLLMGVGRARLKSRGDTPPYDDCTDYAVNPLAGSGG